VKDTTGFVVPWGFWSNGWHLVLTNHEVALLFALYQLAHEYAAAHSRVGIRLPPLLRNTEFSMEDNRYKAWNELVEFGLLEVVTESSPPVDGEPGVVNHFKVLPAGLDHDAFRVVHDRLKDSPNPPRLPESIS
jgi:hypothetical protein